MSKRLPVAFALWLLGSGCATSPSLPDVGFDDDAGADTGTDARPPMDTGAAMDTGTTVDAGDTGPAPVDTAPADTGAVPADTGPTGPCVAARGAGTAATNTVTGTPGTATIAVEDRDGCARTYALTTTAARRDDNPANPRRVTERAGAPVVRTRNDLFDGLYALALEEMRENAVARIQDGAFNNNNPIECPPGGCFETGRLWRYVWTRDTSYSVDLALGALDPTRSRNSLEFKLSTRRGGGDLQIVQDTGSGGAYPVSTDRVVWAMGAWTLLKYLDGAERGAFLDRAWDAVRNTVEHDRRVVYDATDGLYRGEQSFLDWREQSYPAWTAQDTAHLAMSKALSTNVAHWHILDVAAGLAAEKGDEARRARYRMWADGLRDAIRRRFWLPEQHLFSAFTTTHLDPAPVRRYDLLGESFAVLSGVATSEQARDVLARYPHAGAGAAVLWPQQQDTAIYHNRAIWPFVTAYWLRAARQARNDAAVDFNLQSMMRGAALHLSNMENLELVTGQARLEDGAATGPVVNSQRQLWSVAGYLSMVHDVVFGLEATQTGVRFRPYVTRAMRHGLFANADSLVLNDFPYRGRRITVVVALPPQTTGARAGAYAVGATRLDGRAVTAEYITASMLGERSTLEVTLTDTPEAGARIATVADTREYRNVFGPRNPNITDVTVAGGRLQLALDPNRENRADIAFNVYRDGVLRQAGVPGSATTWVDTESAAHTSNTYCYTVESYFTGSGNTSQRAAPRCWWGARYERIQTLLAYDFRAMGGAGVTNHGRFHYENWGDPRHELEVPYFRPNFTGDHLLQVVAGNGAGPINTGVTCAVKLVTVEELPAGTVVAEGYVAMPHLGAWSQWRDSSFVRARLDARRTYRVRIREDSQAVNMSAFAHFERYTGGTGGASGAFNRVNIAEVKVLALNGIPAGTGARVALDGNRDMDDFEAGNRVAPGIRLETWDNVALDWDDDYLYVAVTSRAFELYRDRPFVLYLQTSTEPFGAARPRAGMTYLDQTPTVPFEADWAIAFRRQSDVADGAGPWNGLFRYEGGRWVRALRFEDTRNFWVGADLNRTLSLRLPRSQLGFPARVRAAGHVVSGSGNYNDVLPEGHQPWTAGRTTGFYEIALGAERAARTWLAR